MDNNEQKINVSDCQRREGIFKKVPASELSIADVFMKHQPKTEAERNFKYLVETAIKNGLKDFWRPVFDPSFDDDGHICYEPGKMPAKGKSYIWWKKTVEEYIPERGSRLGTESEYIAFLAVLIKEMVASGKFVDWAWNAVCYDSNKLGHYRNSNKSKDDFELTGSREICGWCDLANTSKILAEDEESECFGIASGDYECCSFCNPLAKVWYCNVDYDRFDDNYFSVGWLVLDSCPEC